MMSWTSSACARLGAVAGIAGAAVLAVPAQAQEWKPNKPIEAIIQTNPGGASDIYMRTWISIIDKHKLSPVPFIPVNRPGGAGAVTLNLLKSRAGDPHNVTPTLNSVITTSLSQKIPVMYPSEDLTPLALMMTDPFLLWTHVGHPDWPTDQASIESGKAFQAWVETCRKRSITSVGTGTKQEDEIFLQLLARTMGCQPITYTPAAGGGQVAAQVAGKHFDVNVNQPAEAMPHFPTRLVPLVMFEDQRDKATFPWVPTHRELKVNGKWGDVLSQAKGQGPVVMHRGVIGPPDIPAAAVKWHEDLFRKVFESTEWQEFMKKNAINPMFTGHEGYKKHLRGMQRNHVEVMRDLLKWELRPDLKPAPGNGS
jgi:putative tricarboxylic transport membrane protein